MYERKILQVGRAGKVNSNWEMIAKSSVLYDYEAW